MIRINLLPVKEKRRRATGQRHLFVIAVLVGLECLAFFYVYSTQADEYGRRKSENTQKDTQIDKLKREVGDIEELQKQKRELEQQQEILDQLEARRSGPVRVLQEIMFLLTPPPDARARVELEKRGGQPNWDSERVSLKTFVEQENQVTIMGEAKSNDDVAEFLTRLSHSRYFYDVRLLNTKLQTGGKDLGEVHFVQFNVRCKVSYSGAPGAEVSLQDMRKKGGH